MRYRDLHGVARTLTLMIGGEAMQSGFHFALNLALVHLLGARDFGVFSFVLVIGGLSLSYVRALAGMPASLSIGRSRLRTAAKAYDVTFGSGAVLLSLFAAVVVDFVLRLWLASGALAGGCFVGLWAVRSYMRTAYFAYGWRPAVVTSDLLFVASGTVMAFALTLVAGADVLQCAFWILAAANVVGICAMLVLARRPFRISYRRPIRYRYRRLWRQLGWSGLSVTATNIQGQLVSLLVTGLCGPAAYAPIAAMLLLFVPLRISATAVVNFLQPDLSAQLARGERRQIWRRVRLWSLATGSVGLAYGAAMLVALPHLHLHILQGVPVGAVGLLVWAIQTTTLLYIMPRILLEVMMAFNAITLLTTVAAAGGFVLIVVILIYASPIWALAGGLSSELLVLMGSWIFASRRLRLGSTSRKGGERGLSTSAEIQSASSQGKGGVA